MNKKIISAITMFLIIVFLLPVFACGGEGGISSSKVKITFKADGAIVEEMEIKKGTNLSYGDLPNITKTSKYYEYEWGVNLFKSFQEDATIEMIKYTKGLQFLENNSTYTVTKLQLDNLNDKPTTLIIPTYYKGKLVTKIGEKAFGNYAYKAYPETEDIEYVIFPEYLETIADEAFSYLLKLKSPKFPATLKHVGFAAFVGCSFDSLDLPAGLLSISPRAFSGSGMNVYFTRVPQGIEILEPFAIPCKRDLVLPVSLVRIADGGIWPPAPHRDPENGYKPFMPYQYDPFNIFYEGDIYEWEQLLPNISDVDVANIVGDGSNDDYDKLFELHSSYDVIEKLATIYIYSEEEPVFDAAHRQNKYWKWDENGKVYKWPDPQR